jgi:hypothetical protein
MKSTPDEIAARFRLRLHLAGKSYPAPRVTDNRAHWHLRRLDHDSTRTPAREAHNLLSRQHKRVSLILQALITWGAVLWAVWYIFL